MADIDHGGSKEKIDDMKTLRQHNNHKRSVPTTALRIGPDRLRKWTITVRQTLRILQSGPK